MADPFASHQPSPDSFGTKSQAVTPNNGTDLDPVAKCIVVTSISGGQSLQLLPVGNADGSRFCPTVSRAARWDEHDVHRGFDRSLRRHAAG